MVTTGQAPSELSSLKCVVCRDDAAIGRSLQMLHRVGFDLNNSLSGQLTARGLREMYLLVFLCLESREAIVSTATEHRNSAWVVKQTEAFIEQTKNRAAKPEIVMHDPDTKSSSNSWRSESMSAGW